MIGNFLMRIARAILQNVLQQLNQLFQQIEEQAMNVLKAIIAQVVAGSWKGTSAEKFVDEVSSLAAVPATRVFEGDIFLCHGTPRDDNASFMDTVTETPEGRIATMQRREHIEAAAAGFDHAVILCGHTHVPRSLRLADGRLVVNPGSVGLPFEIGSPDARYAIVEHGRAGWNTELRAVAYDHQGAAKQALDRGYPHWAEALTWGWASPRGL